METLDRDVQRIAQRAVWSEADGERVAAAWRRSGETIAEFARRYGLPAHRLYYWRDRTGKTRREVRSERRMEGTELPPRFHPVRLLADPGDVGEVAEDVAGRGIEIRVIRIPRGTALEDLQAVVAAFGLRA